MYLFSFDRDSTVAVQDDYPVPLIPVEWVSYLAHETEHIVWAHGNQKLKEEADIPGDEKALELYEEYWGNPIKHVEARERSEMEDWLVNPDEGPDPDIITAMARYKEDKTERPSRDQRVRLIGNLHPECEKYISVDNRYLGYIEGWLHFFPWDFYRLIDQYASLGDLS